MIHYSSLGRSDSRRGSNRPRSTGSFTMQSSPGTVFSCINTGHVAIYYAHKQTTISFTDSLEHRLLRALSGRGPQSRLRSSPDRNLSTPWARRRVSELSWELDSCDRVRRLPHG